MSNISKPLFFKPLQLLGISHSIQSTAMWSMLESFSNPLFSIMLIPILTHNLGLEQYGQYVMVMAFVGLFGFTGLGMNTSITYYLAVNHQTSDAKEIAGRLGTALCITLMGTTVFSLAFLLAFLLYVPAVQYLYPQLIIPKTVVYVALMLLIFNQCDMVISAALKGLQQFKESSKLEFLIRLLGFLAVALITVTLKNIMIVFLSVVIIACLGVLLRYHTINKIVDLHLSNIRLNKQYTREFFHFGKWMTLQNIAGALFGSLDKIIIGSLFGNKVVGIYNVLLSITQLIHFVPASTLTFVLPKVAKNGATLSIFLFKKLFIITLIISGLIAVAVYSFKPLIFSKFSIDAGYDSLFYWLIMCYFLLSLNIPSYFVALGMNLIRIVSLQCIIGSFISILSLLMLVTQYGVLGAATSKIIYSLAALLLFIPVLARMRSDNI